MQDVTTSATGDLSTQLIEEPHPPSPVGFNLLEVVGRGGMGVVYRANDLALGREVAVKVLQERFEPDSTTAVRFVEEARITAQLQHPGVPAVHQVGKLESGRPFLAMKLIRGQTLDALLKAKEPLDVPAVFESIAQAVGYAHAHGVIHRDLKPANVMVGAFGEVQVMDWGLSKVLSASPERQRVESDPEATTAPTEIRSLRDSDGSFTQAGSVLGTPSYMAPEQAGGELDKIDARSDVFGLGAILCAMLTGKPPFQGETAESVRLNAVRGRTEEAFARLDNCAADPALVALCKRCLAFEPFHRPASGDEVAAAVAALRRAADDRAKSAEREKLASDVRRRAFQRAAIVVGFVLALGLMGTGAGLWRADAAKRVAQAAERQADDKRIAAETAQKEAEQAREREAAQKKKAVQLAELADAVRNFLQFEVLMLADPARQQQEGRAFKYDPDVRLRDVVLRAADKIEGKFKDRPLFEAEIRKTLGYALDSMGRSDLAAKQYERVIALEKANLGPNHPDTLTSMHNLAISYSELGRQAEALKVREETLTRKKARLGPDHPETLRSMNALSGSYLELGRYAEALKLREETLALRSAKLGPDHRDTLESKAALATVYSVLGRQAEALKLREEVLALRRTKLGPDHPDTLGSMNGLAVTYSGLGRQAEALRLFEEAFAVMKTKLGVDHPDTLASMHNLADIYSDMGRHEAALKLSEETIAIRKAKLGVDHPDTLASMHNRAVKYASLGRHAEALKLCEETLALMKTKLGPDHRHTLMCRNSLSFIYAALGRHAEALKLREETLALRSATLGPDHPDTLRAEWAVIDSLMSLKRRSEALPRIDSLLAHADRNAATPRGVDLALVRQMFAFRGQVCREANDAAGLRTTAEMWERRQPKDADGLYLAACWRGLVASFQAKMPGGDAANKAKDDADKSMAWLQKAVAAGYKNRTQIGEDDDLDYLRNRDDFKKLMADLEKQAAAQAKAKQK